MTTANRTITFSIFFILANLFSGSVDTVHAADIRNVKDGLWSDPAIWNVGTVPRTGDKVVIPFGTRVTYDVVSNQDVSQIMVEGTLSFSRSKNTQLDVGHLHVPAGGVLEIGTEAAPIPDGIQAAIRLTDVPTDEPTAPVLMTEGGRTEIHGTAKRKTWSKLTANASAGTTVLTLADDVSDWETGDRIVLSGTTQPFPGSNLCQGSPTHFNLTCIDRNSFQSEETFIASVSGNRITVQSPLKYTHSGTAPSQGEVGLLTRNVVIMSKTPDGRRGHTKTMEGGTLKVSFAEFAYLGRKAEPGVYPIHYHLSGNDGRSSYVNGVAVRDSHNIGIRVHGTNFLRLTNNVLYDIVGHGFSTENGNEAWNIFDGNLAIRTKFIPSPTDPSRPFNINPNDPTDNNEGSGFWISNGRNYLRNNVAANADGWGFDLDPPSNTNVTTVDTNGNSLSPAPAGSFGVLEFKNNEGHSSYLGGFEAANFQNTDENYIEGLHAWGSNLWDVYPLDSINFTFANLLAHNSGYFEVYPIRLKNIKITDSRTGRVLINVDRELVERTTVSAFTYGLARSNPTVAVVVGNPGTSQIGFIPGSTVPPNTTSPQEIYLWDYISPGQHIKLVPLNTVAADGLPYTVSSRFTQRSGGATVPLAQEASFSGNEGPPLALPFFIDVGASADTIAPDSKRFRADYNYQLPPPGFTLPRYGAKGGVIRNVNNTVAGSSRVGQTLEYIVDLPSGRYNIHLLFYENWQGLNRSGGVGTRKFDIIAEGIPLVTDLDVFNEAGARTPLVKSFGVTVTDNQLNLNFVGRAGAPYPAMVSAIGICPSSATNCNLGSILGPTPAPTLTFSVSPASITSSQSVTLLWTPANATSCTASANPALSTWSGSKAASGSNNQTVSPSSTTTFTLSCSNSSGASITQTAQVTVTSPSLPNITFRPRLEGRGNLTGLTFTIRVFPTGGTNPFATFTGTGGAITLPANVSLNPGSYDIDISAPYYLRKRQSALSFVNGADFTLNALPSGDLNQDQVINSLDWSIMNPRWFTNDPTSDLNKDGIVNSIDFSLMNRNWGRRGE